MLTFARTRASRQLAITITSIGDSFLACSSTTIIDSTEKHIPPSFLSFFLYLGVELAGSDGDGDLLYSGAETVRKRQDRIDTWDSRWVREREVNSVLYISLSV